MMNEFLRATIYIAAGVLAGIVTAAITRRTLDRPSRRDALRHAARPTATFLFWLLVSAGIVAAVASTSPETLDPIPSDILAWLPRVGVAGLITIAGYVTAALLATTVGRAIHRATGQRHPTAETATRVAVYAAAGVLALSQLGIDTTILNILIAAAAAGIALALAGISIAGGHHIARSVAAGRAIADQIHEGDRITIADHTGTITRITATHITITNDHGDQTIIPLSQTDTTPTQVHTIANG